VQHLTPLLKVQTSRTGREPSELKAWHLTTKFGGYRNVTDDMTEPN
jgi:hypothetical protein